MGVYIRVGYLWAVLVIVTLAIFKSSMSANTLATYSTRVLHERAIGILQLVGPVTLYLTAFLAGIVKSIPFFMMGCALGMSGRMVIWARKRAKSKAYGKLHRMHDKYGVKISMLNAPLDHDPDTGGIQLESIQLNGIFSGTSSIERDALTLLTMYPEHPADLEGHHGTSLAEHTFSTWKLACSRFGAGSLHAQLSICHDLGKIVVYQKDSEGNWRPAGSHRAAGLQVVRDLPSFSRLPEAERSRLIMMLTALLTKDVPSELSDSDRDILRAVNHVDFKATAEEKREKEAVQSADEEDGRRLDPVSIYEQLQSMKESLLGHLNINRSIDANATLHGYYLPEMDVVLIPEQWFRFAMAQTLPKDVAVALGLDAKKSKGKHSARDLVVDVAYLLFRRVDLLCDKPATDGTFTIQTHIRTNHDVIAINAAEISATLKNKWGKWPYEIDVSVPKQRGAQ